MEWTIPAFAFPAEAGLYLPTREGWKAELDKAKYQLNEYKTFNEGQIVPGR